MLKINRVLHNRHCKGVRLRVFFYSKCVWYSASVCTALLLVGLSMMTQQIHYAIMTLLLRNNDVILTFWRYHDVIITSCVRWKYPWWHHVTKTFSPSLALCASTPPVISGFPDKRAVMRVFDISFIISSNKLLNKQSSCQWLEVPWCLCDVTVILLSSPTSDWNNLRARINIIHVQAEGTHKHHTCTGE